MASWDTTRLQAHLRLTAYNLAQLQERHDQTSNITKRDVATLINQADISTARGKVEKLIQDDRLCVLTERLESYCNLLLERFAELDQPIDFESNSPLAEAVCNLVLVAPRTQLKDVVALRDMLVHFYDLDLLQLAAQNYANRFPPQIVEALERRTPMASHVDVYLASIAREHNLSWTPPLLPHQKAHALSEILDHGAIPRVVDLEKLRQICSRGIPPQPPWLRPRVWKLLLGTSPLQKDSWEIDAHSKRQSYYELAGTLLARISALSKPATPLSHLDASLLNLVKSLSPLPQVLDVELEASPLCPFDHNAPEGLKIETAGAVDERLKLIQEHVYGVENGSGTPEIRLEPPDASSTQMPEISISSPTDPHKDGNAHRPPETILHSPIATRSHTTSLLRLVYIHMTLHPSTPTTFLSSLLVPLYVAMLQEIEPADLAHVEADSFWLLAELWGEVGELSDSGESQLWVTRFGRRLAWADPELSEDLVRKGLDPALPHYSFRWLAPLLTRTLSFPSILTIWDALFTRPPRTSDDNARLELLLDICTSMLINARFKLFRLGRPVPKSPGLWGDVDVTVTAPPSTPVEFEEGFIRGMALLQNYPIEELGGPERVIEIAMELDQRRKHAEQKGIAAHGFGERLRGSVWTGFMTRSKPIEPSIPESDNESNGTPSPEWPDSDAEDGRSTAQAPSGALLGKLGSTVWRGITNQNAMYVPPSPLPPDSPAQLLSPTRNVESLPPVNPAVAGAARIGSKIGNSIWRGFTNQSAMDTPPSPTEPPIQSPSRPESEGIASPKSSTGLWSYSEKLRDSDTAASLSKVSTNWSARATALWRRSNPSSTVSSPEYPSRHTRSDSFGMTSTSWTERFPKRGSLPTHYGKGYSPPPRPNFRESRYLSSDERSAPGSPSRSGIGLSPPPDLLAKSKSALASLTGSASTPAPKAGPRPLLLNSSSLITPSNPRRLSRSPTPVARSPQPRDSMSSASSVSTSVSAARYSTHSDRESIPSGSRFVPLRKNISPSPTSSRTNVSRLVTREGSVQHISHEIESEPSHEPSNATRSRNLGRRRSSEENARHGWGKVQLLDSPSTLPSGPPKTPATQTANINAVVNGVSERQQGSVVLTDLGDAGVSPVDRKVGHKKSWNGASKSPTSPWEAASDSSTSQGNAPPVRSKRHGQRPANLRLKKSDSDLGRFSSTTVAGQQISGDLMTLMPESLPEATVNTPRATDFSVPGSPGRHTRPRKHSRSPRRALRKNSLPEKTSGGEEGDDEGYDEFLSAYESEDGAKAAAVQ